MTRTSTNLKAFNRSKIKHTSSRGVLKRLVAFLIPPARVYAQRHKEPLTEAQKSSQSEVCLDLESIFNKDD